MKNWIIEILMKLFFNNLFDLKSLNLINGSKINDNSNCDLNNTLDISNFVLYENRIQDIPAEILYGPKPLKIDLSNRNLTYLLPELVLFKNLVCINLCYNLLTDICELPKSLKCIFLVKNNLNILPEHFFNLTNLETLILRHNLISELPKSIGKFTNLRRLDISYNNISKLPSSIKELINVETICLKCNEIKSLPNSVNKLINLCSMDMSHNELIEFPDNCENLNKLNILNLANNSITNIKTICKIKTLEILCLDNNNIMKIPSNIYNLENLKDLFLSENNISRLPKEFAKCKKLTQLCLSNNSISNIETLCEMKELEYLSLFNNQIFEIPSNICNLENLSVLDLSKNNISYLPKEFGKCKKLKKLYLLINSITNIETICEIQTLEYLSLFNNQIVEISNNIYKLKNLKDLNLTNNFIYSLPKEFANCEKLRFLYLNNNKIKNIPVELFSLLSNLELLDLRENPLIYPVNSTEIDIYELKVKMGDRLLIDDIYYKGIREVYFHLNKQPCRFNLINFKKCRPLIEPTHIYSELELLKKINDWKEKFNKNKYKDTADVIIMDPNEFTNEVKSFDTSILCSYIHHLYNPEKIYPRWNVPVNLLENFKKYIGAIVFKIFSSDDDLFIEGHLNSLSIAICYCPERHKNEMMFLYELLINEEEKNLKQLQQNELKLKQESKEHLENLRFCIENTIKRFIGTIKMKILMDTFGNSENNQNVHSYNYWKYVLKDHIGLDVFGDKPELIGRDKFNGRIELGLHAFFKKFTPEWLIIELKQYINNDSNLICKISEFLYYSDIQNKIRFVECEEDDILFTKSITEEFCKFILQEMEIIILK